MNLKKTKSKTRIYIFGIVLVTLVFSGIYFAMQPSGNSRQKILDEISNLIILSNQKSLTSSDLLH